MLRKFIILLGILLIANVSHANRVSCKQFNHQSEAQQYFNAGKKGSKSLDRDKDGEACECLKGGSSYSDSRCKSWRKKNKKK